MSNYFEKGVKRTSATARLPLAISEKLDQLRDLIQQETTLKISKNDLVTIGAILIAETHIKKEDLSNVGSISEIHSLFKKLNSKQE